MLLAAHVGLAILVALAVGLPANQRKELPTVDRAPVDPDGRCLVYFFALAPAAAMTLFAMLVGGSAPIPVAPLAVLSGLAVMAAAPDSLRLVHQRLAGDAWAALVVLPPLLAIGAVTALPWIYRLNLIWRSDSPPARWGASSAKVSSAAPAGRSPSLPAMSAPQRSLR